MRIMSMKIIDKIEFVRIFIQKKRYRYTKVHILKVTPTTMNMCLMDITKKNIA